MDKPLIPETQGPGKKPGHLRWLTAALIVLLITAAAGAYTRYSLRSSCNLDAVQQAVVFLTTQLNMYDRVYQVAITASRTAPHHPVNTLKQIVMDTQELNVPVCVQTAKNELINYMGTVILAFQAYRAGKADATVEDLIQRSEAQYVNFRSEMTAVKECAPYCIPSLRELRAYDWIPYADRCGAISGNLILCEKESQSTNLMTGHAPHGSFADRSAPWRLRYTEERPHAITGSNIHLQASHRRDRP